MLISAKGGLGIEIMFLGKLISMTQGQLNSGKA